MNRRRLKGMVLAPAASVLIILALMVSACSKTEDGNKNETDSNIKLSEDNTGEETKETDQSTEPKTESPTETKTEPHTETKTDEAGNTTADNSNPASGEAWAIREHGYDERVVFHNAAFMGDSRVAGLDEKLVVSGADFYASVGVTVKDVDQKKKFVLKDGTMGTMMDAICENEGYERIYLMFGINELGWPSADSFVGYYADIVEALKLHFPLAEIYVQSIMPMVESRTDEIYNNTKIKLFNEAIKKMASEEGVKYIDVGVAVQGKDGTLPNEASNDGIHLSRDYCFAWAEYLKAHTEK